MNSILQTGIVPDDFKHAVVTPIYKSEPKQVLDNYRPVNLKALKKVLNSPGQNFIMNCPLRCEVPLLQKCLRRYLTK